MHLQYHLVSYFANCCSLWWQNELEHGCPSSSSQLPSALACAAPRSLRPVAVADVAGPAVADIAALMRSVVEELPWPAQAMGHSARSMSELLKASSEKLLPFLAHVYQR